MKSAALVSFAVLLGSVASGAQAPGQTPSETTVFRTQPPATACPVSLRAQHGATGGMLQADKGRPKGLAQLLLLTLTSPDSRQIVRPGSGFAVCLARPIQRKLSLGWTIPGLATQFTTMLMWFGPLRSSFLQHPATQQPATCGSPA